jgi:MoxR-like ATPase
MEEEQVTAEGETRPLPQPFFVVATQNPSNQIGVFPLPESQLDRFLMRLELGYPDRAAERALLAGQNRRELVASLKPVLVEGNLQTLQHQVQSVHAAPALIDYVQSLVERSRHNQAFALGLSPRASLGLLSAARAWAYVHGRDMVLPEDVQAVLPAVTAHRLKPAASSNGSKRAVLDLIGEWVKATPIP